MKSFLFLAALVTTLSSTIAATRTSFINTVLTFNEEGKAPFKVGGDQYTVITPEGLTARVEDVYYGPGRLGKSVITEVRLPSSDVLALVSRIFSTGASSSHHAIIGCLLGAGCGNNAGLGFELSDEDLTLLALNNVNRKYLFKRQQKNAAMLEKLEQCLQINPKPEVKRSTYCLAGANGYCDENGEIFEIPLNVILYNTISIPFYCGPEQSGDYFELKINVDDRPEMKLK